MTMERMSKQHRWRMVLSLSLPLSLLLAVVASLGLGAVTIHPSTVINILISGGEYAEEAIIMQVRLPRILLAILVGAALAVAGAILQGTMRNPLADSSIIGITAGGGLAASIAMVALPQFGFLLPPIAFIASCFTAVVIYMLSWNDGTSPLKIILSGVAINAMLSAVQSGIMILYSDRVQAVLPWLAGGLQGRGWYHVEFVTPYVIVGLVLSLFSSRYLNVLMLGNDSAISLGTKVETVRLLLIMLAALLAGAAVSVAGLLGFVGLLVPHAIRLLCGSDHRWLLPLSIFAGALLVVIADTLARTLFDPLELPVGILLAMIGAPWFLIIVRRQISVK